MTSANNRVLISGDMSQRGNVTYLTKGGCKGSEIETGVGI